MSKAKTLAANISARLSEIRIANGYLTDIGASVKRGKLTFNESEAPCIVLVEGDDDPIEQQNLQCRLSLSFIAEGHDVCDPENPNDKIHDIATDIKKAIFGDDTTFGGLVKPNRNATPGLRYTGSSKGVREDGSKLVSCGIQFECEIVEDLSNP